MDYDQSGDRLTVRLTRDFNWLAVRRIEPLAQRVRHVDIDLSEARLIDSEALMLIDRLQRAGKTVQLRNPPDLLYEIIDALEAESVFDVDTLVS